MPDTVFIKGEQFYMDYTPVASLAAGQVKVIGDCPCICNLPGGFTYDSGNTTKKMGIAIRGGIYSVTADGAIPARTRVFWDDTAKKITLTAGANQVFGVTCATAAAADGAVIPCEHEPFAGPVRKATGTVAAAGSVQGDAAALVERFNVVSAADGTKGVILPTPYDGMEVPVKNNVNAVLKVYPTTGKAINALAANAAISMAALSSATFRYRAADSIWYTDPTVPS